MKNCITPSPTTFIIGNAVGNLMNTGITTNLVDSGQLTNSFSFNIFDEVNGAMGSGGSNDVTLNLKLITGFDPYEGAVLNPKKGNAATTGHHVRQTASGLQGGLPHGNIVANRSSTGDVIGYSIFVDFADHVEINAQSFGVRYTSGNTNGTAYESSSIVFLNQNN